MRILLRPRPLALAAGALLLGAAGLCASARAEPVYKDLERFEAGGGAAAFAPHDRRRAPGRPARRLTPGPGYVGSDWGLGKPSYAGIGSRPDWGYWAD